MVLLRSKEVIFGVSNQCKKRSIKGFLLGTSFRGLSILVRKMDQKSHSRTLRNTIFDRKLEGLDPERVNRSSKFHYFNGRKRSSTHLIKRQTPRSPKPLFMKRSWTNGRQHDLCFLPLMGGSLPLGCFGTKVLLFMAVHCLAFSSLSLVRLLNGPLASSVLTIS